MPYRYVTRSALEEQLAAVDANPSAAAALRAWVRDVVIGDDVELDIHVESLILAAVEKLDLASANDGDLTEVARELRALLRDVEDDDVAKDLVPLARDRVHVTQVLRKVVGGHISRTGWLSYVAEQRWPAAVKNGLAALDSSRLDQLLNALVSSDYKIVATVLNLGRR